MLFAFVVFAVAPCQQPSLVNSTGRSMCSDCVLSLCICQDRAMSQLAEAAFQVTSFREAREGNPDGAQTE